MDLEAWLLDYVSQITPITAADESAAWERLDRLTKPPRSLGHLERIAARVASIQQTQHPDVDYCAIVVAAADHGVVARGVSAYPQDVTWQMVANFVAGGAAVNQLSAAAEAELWLVDVGVARELSDLENVRHMKIRTGTDDITRGPAMTREECLEAVRCGVDLAEEACADGVRMLGLGEMGIGNSTSAAALTAAYLGIEPESVVGPGTGLDPDGVARKTDAVRDALAANPVTDLDAIGVLAALGGLEIACLAGIAVGAARRRVPVVTDGFIATSAVLAATRISEAVGGYVIAGHRSPEPGHGVQLEALGLEPVLDLEMRLGEGSGAAVAFRVIDSACRMMAGMATFAEAGVSTSEDLA